jgi:hypothetical protein
MHITHVPKPRRILGFVGLVAAALTISTMLSSTAAAQSATNTSVCPGGVPILTLDNPNPGDVLPTGDIVFSGVAFDSTTSSSAGTGITGVDLFLGNRDAGGAFLGSAIPGSGMGGSKTWQTTVTIPQSGTGGRNFVAYARSVSGQEARVSVPVFVGAAPTPTPIATDAAPVALASTISTTCQLNPAARAGGMEGMPVLSLANPAPGAVLPVADLLVEGLAYDPAAGTRAGVDRVSIFLDSRDSGGIEIGSGVPGVGSNPRAFQITARFPSNANGQHNFVVYARSSVDGQEAIASVPVFIGAAPTPTPRPLS